MSQRDGDDEPIHLDQPYEGEGIGSLLRRGLGATPELRDGLAATALIGLLVAVGKLTVPIIIQRTIDDGFTADEVNIGRVWANVAAGAVVVAVVAFASWVAHRRLSLRAETGIANLRTKAFNRIHQLSIADHNESRRGVLVARVTSDAEALARFAQWGLFSWSINPLVLLGITAVLAYYSWQVAIVAVAAHIPVVVLLRWFQKRQLAVYDVYRTSVGNMLGVFSEAVTGAGTIRAYGMEDKTRRSLDHAVADRYKHRMRANKYMAGLFVIGDFFGAVAVVAVLGVSLWQRNAWGLTEGEVLACLILTNLMREPIAELSETFDQTQTAAAAWRKVLNVLDHEVDVVEPLDGTSLGPGPIGIEVSGLSFAYRAVSGDPEPVLTDVSVTIPAGANVAIVGQTGSGKTTFAKMLCRLADPVSGSIKLNGVELASLSPEARVQSVRMVPQDGFLFNTTLAENVAFGAAAGEEPTEEQILGSFKRLGLDWWVSKLPNGLATEAGERGDNLSVGERQLVALARAQLADPGLLVLDEATSAVDPETDQALTDALQHLAEGRTMISIAHRLATAEAADLILVFDQGRLVEQGPHTELVDAGGIYTGLHKAWIGNTRTT